MKKRTKRAPTPAAKSSPDLFRVAFHNSPAMQTLTRTTDRVLVEVNDAFLRTMGYTREEVLGKAALELNIWLHPERAVPFREELAAQGFVRGYEVEVRTKAGDIRTVLLSADLVDIDGVPHVVAAGVDITARKDAEARLRESERRLRESEALLSSAFHASPVLLTIAPLATAKFVRVNDAFVRLSGYALSEILGRDTKDLGLWVNLEARAKFFEQLQRERVVRNVECQIRTRRGAIREMQLSAEVVEINGEPHLITFGLDITEQKRAEAELRESEQRLRESEARFSTAFRASPALMTIARLADGGYVEVNDAFVRWIGRERPQILGHSWQEFAMWDDPALGERFFAELLRTQSVRNEECELRRPDGSKRVLLVSADIIEINREPHVLGFAVDISEQKWAERALRESEARARALYESISAAVVVQDESGYIQINSASLNLFGATGKEGILGKRPQDFSPARQPNGEDSAVAAQQHLARTLAEGTDHFEWLARKLDGTEFPVEVTATRLQFEGRDVVQSVIIDLTERKRAEAELQNALAKERELNQLKSDFVSLVSHEFRTPLEVIMSSADNLERYHDRLPAEKRSHLLRTIHKSVARMSDMMEEVLLLGRLESGGTQFHPATVDVASFCQRLCDEMESATSGRCPIKLTLTKDPGIGRGDEAVLRHIFTNLLSNAVKYSEAGKEVDFAMRREADDAVFRVTDRGCGIPASDQARLFQAFHRARNVRHVAGTGLGLVIVRRSVALHGGEIGFESTEGQGTTFTVRLPLFAKGDEP